jgi:glycosyltransferase involved in cell wall biosynthesis
MEMSDMNNELSKQDLPSVGRSYRILLVVRWPVGGIRTFIRYVYRHFEPDLFKFTILGPDHPEMNILLEDLKDLNVEIKRVSKLPSSYAFFKEIFKIIANGGYDMVHSQGFTSGICTALPAFLFRRPHILTSHDVLSEKQFKGFKGLLKKIGMGMAFSMAQTIHSVSHDAQDNLLEYFPFLGKKARKCVVIPHGIEVERFVDVVPRDLRKELGVGEETFLIGFLGRFMSQKGFAYLVDATECLSKNENLPKKILVVAFGEGGFIREEKAQISERGLEQYFRFLPFTPNVAGVLKSLDVVVMPSLWEACGLLAMEALVAGTPLIVTSCIGLREVVRNTPAYVVPPGNAKALAEGIELFMMDDRKKIFKTFAKEAASLFDVKRQAEKIRLLVSDALHE